MRRRVAVEPIRGERRQFLADLELAALHMARTVDGVPRPGRDLLGRWKVRIPVWASRYPEAVRRYGRDGRRTLYDLRELEAQAARLSTLRLDDQRSA